MLNFVNKCILLLFLSIIPFVLIPNLGLISPEYANIILSQVTNTAIVVVSVTTISSIIGVICAWLFSMYEFPLKKPIETMLITSMVYPTYVLAFFYTEFFNTFGLGSLIATMVVATLPYVFMIVTMTFRSQSQQLVNTALMFGKNNLWIKLKVLFPLIVPSIMLSALLVVGETFSEFGATHFFGVSTVMTGIFEIWFALGESVQGIRLTASVFCVVIIIYYFVIVWQKVLFHFQSMFENNDMSETIAPRIPSNNTGWLMTLFSGLIATITFIIPSYVLMQWVISSFAKTNFIALAMVSFNSIMLATLISFLVLLLTTLVYVVFKNRMMLLTVLANTLYSTPGIVLAVAATFIVVLTTPKLTPLLFVYVLVMKFWAMGMNNIGIGIQKINQKFYYVSETFKKSGFWYIWNVQIPLSMKGYIVASVMVWIDVIRELVIGLTLRPPGFDLLSVKIYSFMDSEMISMSGPWILTMVLITILPFLYLKMIAKKLNNK